MSRKLIACGSLILAGLFLGIAGAEPQKEEPQKTEPQKTEPRKKGIPVEVQLQDNARVKFELREVVPAYNDGDRLSFTKKIEPRLSQILWSQMPLDPDAKRGFPLKEIRIADHEPLRLSEAPGTPEYLLYPVVLVPVEGFTASFYWQGANLSGVSQSEGGAPRPVSIPISNIKVVRFLRQQGS